MDIKTILEEKQDIIKKYGEWTAHNIDLGNGIYTISDQQSGYSPMPRRFLQVANDIMGKPIKDMRVLDLACLEGAYAIEFARNGAEVVGIEGREANIEKAFFAKKVLGLDNLTFVKDDVLNLSKEKYGEFDVVICSGILYHIDAPEVFSFIKSIYEVTTKLAFFDTQFSLSGRDSVEFEGKTYYGNVYKEHYETASDEDKEKVLWASLNNNNSFWFTKPSLFNFLNEAGFNSTYECKSPIVYHNADRETFIALKEEKQDFELSYPIIEDFWSENSKRMPTLSKKNLSLVLSNLEKFFETCKNKRVCFYGAGQSAQETVKYINLSGLDIVGFVDKDEAKHGKKIGDYTIYPIEELKNLKPDIVVISVIHKVYVVSDLVNIKNDLNLEFEIVENFWS
jgi:SAM-dependent methyltransferase